MGSEWKQHGSYWTGRTACPSRYASSKWQKKTQGFILVFLRTGKTQKCGSLGLFFSREVCMLKSQALHLQQLNIKCEIIERLREFQYICLNSGGSRKRKWFKGLNADQNQTSALKSGVLLWHPTQYITCCCTIKIVHWNNYMPLCSMELLHPHFVFIQGTLFHAPPLFFMFPTGLLPNVYYPFRSCILV